MHHRGVATPMISANKPYHHHIYIVFTRPRPFISKPTFGIYGTIENSGDVQLPHCLPENKDIVTSQLEVVLHGDYDADDADKAVSRRYVVYLVMCL